MGQRRYTRKLAKRGGATYREQQKAALCGKHAINHVLQEEKFVWEPRVKTLYIPTVPAGEDATAHAKKQGTQINLVMACKEYENDELNQRLAKLYPGLLASLIRRLLEDVEPESGDIRIPPVGSSERAQPKFKGKTDAEIRKIIEDGRGEAFKVSQRRQAEERAKYKKYITVDGTGKVTNVNREALDVVYKKEWSADEKKTIETEGTVCQPGGNIIPEIFTKWGNILGLKGFTTTINDVSGDESIYKNDPDIYLAEMIKLLPSQLQKPEFLGVMLGRLGDRVGHYTAVVMYDDGDCEPKRRVEADMSKKLYSYIDSMYVTGRDGVCTLNKGQKACYTQKDLLDVINKYGPTCMIFLYGYDADDKGPLYPYESVAYQRMKEASAAPAPTTEESNKEAESNNEDPHGILKNANEREAEEARKRSEELEEERFWKELNWQGNYHPSPNNYASKEEWKKAMIEEARQQKSKDPANIAAVRERRRRIHESISSIPFEEYEKSKLSKKDDDSDSNSDDNSESDDNSDDNSDSNSDDESNEDPNVKAAIAASVSSAEEDEKVRKAKAATEASLAGAPETSEQVYEKEMARIKSLKVSAKMKTLLEDRAKAQKLVAVNEKLYDLAVNPPKGSGVKTSAAVMKENSPSNIQKRLDKWVAKLKEAEAAIAKEEAKL